MADAESGPAPLRSAVPVDRVAVRHWREPLLGLAEQLDVRTQTSVAASARILVLLRDGTGPLYNGHAEHSLSDSIWWIADAFRSCPPHDWRCPVVAKMDPTHAAWTCARCGAIAMSDDAAVRPDQFAGRPA